MNETSLICNDTKFFNKATQKAFIFGPSQNAFSKYDDILQNILANYDVSWLVYIEMGAMTTVLSYNLSKLGYQALDMGDFYRRVCLSKQT